MIAGMTDNCPKLERLILNPESPNSVVPALIPYMDSLSAITSLTLDCYSFPLSTAWDAFPEAVSSLVCLQELQLHALIALPDAWMLQLFGSLRCAPDLKDLHLGGTDEDYMDIMGEVFTTGLQAVPQLTSIAITDAMIELPQLLWSALPTLSGLEILSLRCSEV